MRRDVVPVALAIGVLALAGCDGSSPKGAASASTSPTPSATPSTSTPSATSSSSAPSSTPSSTTDRDPLSALPSAQFKGALLTPVQVGRFAPDMVRSTSEDEGDEEYDGGDDEAYDDGDDHVSGEGGTCPRLAQLFDRDSFLPGADPNAADVSYDNTDSVEDLTAIRTVDQTIETHPSGDLATQFASYRATIQGCHSALVDSDGTRYLLRLESPPTGYGAPSLAYRLTVSAQGQRLVGHLAAKASGRNVLAIATGGFGRAQTAAILAQVEKNLSAPHASATDDPGSTT